MGALRGSIGTAPLEDVMSGGVRQALEIDIGPPLSREGR
jgi:hypothetical protein